MLGAHMVLRIPTFKISGTGASSRGAARPSIFALLDGDMIQLRRAGTATLDPLESPFTIAEAQGLSTALQELLKAYAEEEAKGARTEEGAQEQDFDAEDLEQADDSDTSEVPPARFAVAR